MFRFKEFNVRDYETLHALYSAIITPASYGFLRYYFSTTTGIYNAIKVVVGALMLIVAIVVVITSRAKETPQGKAVEQECNASSGNESDIAPHNSLTANIHPCL
jgi:hypothetical protein